MYSTLQHLVLWAVLRLFSKLGGGGGQITRRVLHVGRLGESEKAKVISLKDARVMFL